MITHHPEPHRTQRTGWLRAAVLGANDGILSTASLIVGVAAADADQENIALAGVAGLVAGAMSMAAGEYVSVKTQADTEAADLLMEEAELEKNPELEEAELAEIYINRGLKPELAAEVARQMTEHDALGAHARDEIGISHALSARPLEAAVTSAGMFACGAGIPVITALFVSGNTALWLIPLIAIVLLVILGAVGAMAGGASPVRGAMRVCFWGTLAMVLTAGIGKLFGVAV